LQKDKSGTVYQMSSFMSQGHKSALLNKLFDRASDLHCLVLSIPEEWCPCPLDVSPFFQFLEEQLERTGCWGWAGPAHAFISHRP